MARRIVLLALAAAFLSLPAQATTTVATHSDPSASSADPVFSIAFGAGVVVVNFVPVLSTLTLSGSYSEDDANGSPHAPLQLISGVSFDDWDFVFEPTAFSAVANFGGITMYYNSAGGSFAYYVAGSAHGAADLIFSGSFSAATLTIPSSGVGSLDLGTTAVELVYGAASGLSGTTLGDPEQFGFSFANYVGNPGTDLDGPYSATATASFTSSAEVEVAEPCCAALGGLVLAGLAARRRRAL